MTGGESVSLGLVIVYGLFLWELAGWRAKVEARRLLRARLYRLTIWREK